MTILQTRLFAAAFGFALSAKDVDQPVQGVLYAADRNFTCP